MKMWSGRFRQPLDPHFEEWQRSFPFDQQAAAGTNLRPAARTRRPCCRWVLSACGVRAMLLGAGRDLARPASRSPDFLDDGGRRRSSLRGKEAGALIGETGKKLHADAAAMSRSPPTCVCSCATPLIDLRLLAGRFSQSAAGRARKRRKRRPCLPTRICSGPNRCWLSHWLLAYFEMFCATANACSTAASG